jgi:hypothetical protein
MSGIKGNDSKEVVVGSIVYYGGIADVRVVAINPDGETLKKVYNLDDLKEEPKYTDITFKNEEGIEETYNKIVFHVQGEQAVITNKKDMNGIAIRAKETIKTRIEFLVRDEFKIASTGSVLTINALGNSSYQSEEKMLANPKMAWFTKYTPMHQAKIGEVELLEFVRNWMNVGSKDICNFDNYALIAQGNVGELIAMAKARPTNEVTVLLGAKESTDKDGKPVLYQTVYKKVFSRPTAKNKKDIFNKALNDNYGEFKALYPSNLELTYIEKETESDKPDAGLSAPASTNGWV